MKKKKVFKNDIPDQYVAISRTEFEILPLESEFYHPTPVPFGISWASDPPPPTPLGFPMGYEYGTPFKGYFTKIEHNINTRNNGCSLKFPKPN